MTDNIEPALTSEEWEGKVEYEYSVNHGSEYIADGPEAAHKIIALANAALPEGDPRKITREMVTLIRESERAMEAEGVATEDYRPLARIADALESYLPPE